MTPLRTLPSLLALLAANAPSGAQDIEPFLATRGTSVGIDVFCRQPPACPRLQGFSLALP